jgi:ferric-dicitrate binding protein FerR (iron transport regulator)
MDFKLIIKKLHKTLTYDETVKFSEWYNESPEHRAYFKKVVSNFPNNLEAIHTDKAWKALQAKIDDSSKKKPLWNYSVAASLALLMALSYYFITNNSSKASNLIVVEHSILTGTDKAALTLQDGSNIDLEKDSIFTSDYLKSDGQH